MLFEATACTETISILEAIALGGDGACIDIGLSSVLGAVAGFIAVVLLIRFVAMQVLRRIFPGLARKQRRSASMTHEPDGAVPLPHEGPIRSTGAWGRKPG